MWITLQQGAFKLSRKVTSELPAFTGRNSYHIHAISDHANDFFFFIFYLEKKIPTYTQIGSSRGALPPDPLHMSETKMYTHMTRISLHT